MMGGRSAHSLLHLLYYSFIPVSSPRSSLSAWVFILPPASFCFRESKLLRKHAPLLRRPMAARRVQGLDFITESFHSVCRLFPVELERKKNIDLSHFQSPQTQDALHREMLGVRERQPQLAGEKSKSDEIIMIKATADCFEGAQQSYLHGE